MVATICLHASWVKLIAALMTGQVLLQGTRGRLAAVASSLAALALVLPPAAMAADGYWLDQYNALLP